MAHHWSAVEMLHPMGDHWLLIDQGRKLAILKEVTIEPIPTKLIRSVTYHDDPEQRVLIGYFTDLRHAAHVTFYEWLRANGRVPRGYV